MRVSVQTPGCMLSMPEVKAPRWVEDGAAVGLRSGGIAGDLLNKRSL